MVKLYARVPTEVSQEGSLIRFFNGQGEKIKIKEVNENKSSIFSILSHKSQSKYIANSSLLKYEWLVSNNDKFNNVETEHIGISLNRIKSEYLGVIWIPKNLYRPGDIIKGYIFLRKRREASKESIQLVETDPSNPITIELKDAKNDIVHVSPIMKTSTPIIYFEIPVDQYTEIGPYSLELKRGKDSLNKIKISLSLYEKPDIKLSIHMPNWSLAGTNIHCEISANYFFGEPVKEGKLTISSNAWESDIDNPFHENIDLELPDCLPGEYSINFELTDKVGRKVNEIKQIKIVKEPLQIEYALFPLEKPIIESQHVEIVLKIMDPLGIPLSKIRVKCLINSEQDKNSIVNNVYYSDENGYIKIDLNSLSFGKYTVEIMTVNEEINVKLIDSFEVRKVASTDIWLSFSSLPNKVLPGERITGKIIIEGPGQKLIDSDSIFLDCISDKVYDSQELKIINNNDFGEAEFKIDIPTNYFGQIVIEAYFSPSLTEILEKKLNTKPKDWVGETFELGKLSTKKILDINYQKHKIDFQVNTPSEITTGTNFDINIQLSDKNLSNKIWYGVFLSDERILYEFQPVSLKDSFYSPKNLINVVNIGSVLKFPPMPAIAERSRSLGGYPTTYMRNDRFNRGYLASLRSLTSKMMIEDINKRQKSQLTDSGEQKIVEEKIIRQIFRTEFPEDIVLEPKLLEKKDTAINIKSPDSITTYKIICVVCSETEFGIVEKKIVVRNPIFTSTLNPPEMILSDDIYIPTVIENLSKSVLEDIEISASTNENLLLQEKTVNIPRIAPYSKHSVFWNIIAQKVGNAQLTTYLKTKNFSELSELERPLRIQPPGTPHKTFYHTKLLSNKPWEQEINITGNEAFNLIIINFLPGLDLAIIEGVESLVSYPYGCCEQTSASTLPNPIAYRYLESNNKLTKDIQVSLIRNMQTGLTRYLNIFHNKENGGFGLWDGKRPSIFHTSLVLSVLGRIKDFIEVPDIIFEKAKEFLSSKQFQDGSYEPESGIDKNFPTTLTKLSMTAYVVHSQALGGIIDISGIKWLINQLNNSEINEDPTVLALLLDSISMHQNNLDIEIRNIIEEILNLLINKVQNSKKGAYWIKGSSLSSEIETTAYALVAIIHSKIINNKILDILKSGSDFLLNTRTSNGWNTTRDTLWASLALGEIAYYFNQENLNGVFKVNLNNEVLKEVEITPSNKYFKIYELRNIHLDELNVGKNKINISLFGKGMGYITVELRQWFSESLQKQLSLDISQKFDSEIKQDEIFNLDYKINCEKNYEAVMIEQPIPAGCSIQESLLDSLRSLKEVDHVEINNNKISTFLTTLNGSININYQFIPKLKGKIQIDGIRVIPMYQPETLTTYMTKWIEILSK